MNKKMLVEFGVSLILAAGTIFGSMALLWWMRPALGCSLGEFMSGLECSASAKLIGYLYLIVGVSTSLLVAKLVIMLEKKYKKKKEEG